MFMSSPVKKRAVVDIRATVEAHRGIAAYLLAIHGLSVSDTIASLHGIGKGTVLKTKYGWEVDHQGILLPRTLPPDTVSAPPDILRLIHCNCKTFECWNASCSYFKLGWTIFFSCEGVDIYMLKIPSHKTNLMTSEHSKMPVRTLMTLGKDSIENMRVDDII